jgi:cytochrome oxidase assembly protein ShyY1
LTIYQLETFFLGHGNLKQSTIRRWAPWLALVLVFSLATTLLSLWQLDRREQRVEQIQQVLSNYEQPPIPLSEISWERVDDRFPLEWRPVSIEGEYLDEIFLVRNRPLAGQAGFLQLVPMRLKDGRILVVDRGWLAASSSLTQPEANPKPIPGKYELVVRLRAGEPDLGREQADTLASIDLIELADRLNSEAVITDFYGRLVDESPANPIMPTPMPKPSLNEGNHLSYAIQWIIFGLMAFGAFIWAYRNDRRLLAEARGDRAPRPKKLGQADRDAEFEDANQ